MKTIFITYLSVLISMNTFAQVDSTSSQFDLLIEKVQMDKTLSGVFLYKGHNVRISESDDFKSAIGKVIEVVWMYNKDNNFASAKYKAVFHNTFGYMTRGIFGQYKRIFKDFKVDKDKYCQETFCMELKTNFKLPYIQTTRLENQKLREIK